jgi:hypothetical protein
MIDFINGFLWGAVVMDVIALFIIRNMQRINDGKINLHRHRRL